MIRSTFMGFEIAKRGIQTSQKGLDIAGHNMANWDSAGYTRQRVDQVSVSPYYNTTRYNYAKIGSLGQGVGASGVGQIRDTFLDKRFRDEQSENSYNAMAQNILYDIESAIGEFNPDSNAGIRGCMETLLSAISSFAAQPDSETASNIVQSEFKNLTQTLKQLSSKLDKVSLQHKYDLKLSVDEVNGKLQSLANINDAIMKNTLGIENEKYGPNELLDERNLILDELSRYGNIDVQVNKDYTVTLKMGGHTVVDGGKAEVMEYLENSDGTVAMRWTSTGEKCNFSAGALKGYTDFINGRGTNISSPTESPYKGIPYYQDMLNAFANTLAKVVNNTIPDTFDADGNALTYKKLLDSVGGVVGTDNPITASNIAISDEWVNDPSYAIALPGNKESKYVLALQTALKSEKVSFGSNSGGFTGTFYEFVDSYSAVLAEDHNYYDGRLSVSTTGLSDLQDRRDAVSGVSIDEETVTLMLYNKSFQAASRLMTTLDEALDMLINKTGLVGR